VTNCAQCNPVLGTITQANENERKRKREKDDVDSTRMNKGRNAYLRQWNKGTPGAT